MLLLEAENLLAIRNLAVEFATDSGVARAVTGIDIDVPTGATVVLVGESGCGKSAAALAIMGLLPPPARITAGKILFDARHLPPPAPPP